MSADLQYESIKKAIKAKPGLQTLERVKEACDTLVAGKAKITVGLCSILGLFCECIYAQNNPEKELVEKYEKFQSYTGDLLKNQYQFYEVANKTENWSESPELAKLAQSYWNSIEACARNGDQTCKALIAKSLLWGTAESKIRNLSSAHRADYSNPDINIAAFIKSAEQAIGIKKETYLLRQAGILCLLGAKDSQGIFLITEDHCQTHIGIGEFSDLPQWKLESLRSGPYINPEKGKMFLEKAHFQGDYQASELLARFYAEGNNPQKAAQTMQEAIAMLNTEKR